MKKISLLLCIFCFIPMSCCVSVQNSNKTDIVNTSFPVETEQTNASDDGVDYIQTTDSDFMISATELKSNQFWRVYGTFEEGILVGVVDYTPAEDSPEGGKLEVKNLLLLSFDGTRVINQIQSTKNIRKAIYHNHSFYVVDFEIISDNRQLYTFTRYTNGKSEIIYSDYYSSGNYIDICAIAEHNIAITLPAENGKFKTTVFNDKNNTLKTIIISLNNDEFVDYAKIVPLSNNKFVLTLLITYETGIYVRYRNYIVSADYSITEVDLPDSVCCGRLGEYTVFADDANYVEEQSIMLYKDGNISEQKRKNKRNQFAIQFVQYDDGLIIKYFNGKSSLLKNENGVIKEDFFNNKLRGTVFPINQNLLLQFDEMTQEMSLIALQ